MAEKIDARDQFLQEQAPRRAVLPPAAVEDLRHFRKRHDEGCLVPRHVVISWIKKQYGGSFGRAALYDAAERAGIKPWWSRGT